MKAWADKPWAMGAGVCIRGRSEGGSAAGLRWLCSRVWQPQGEQLLWSHQPTIEMLPSLISASSTGLLKHYESGRSLRALPLRNRFSIGCPNIYISNIDLYAQIHAATLEIAPFIIRLRILQLQPDLRPSVTIRMWLFPGNNEDMCWFLLYTSSLFLSVFLSVCPFAKKPTLRYNFQRWDPTHEIWMYKKKGCMAAVDNYLIDWERERD